MQDRRMSLVPLDIITDGCVDLDVSIQHENIRLFLNEVITRDQHGITYKGKWGNRFVAVKMVKIPKYISDEAQDELQKKIEQEMALGLRASFFSEHIVRSYGIVWMPSGEFGLITEFMERGNLTRFLSYNQSKRVDLESCLRIGSQVAAALVDIHALGMQHNNLISTSVLLTDKLEAKLTNPLPTDPYLDTYVGTLSWRLPKEVPDYVVAAPKSSDIYRLGLILWELATHRKTFVDVDTTNLARGQRWLTQLELEQALDECKCPADFKQLILDCLSLDVRWYPLNPHRKREKKTIYSASSITTTSQPSLEPTVLPETKQLQTLSPVQEYNQGVKLFYLGHYPEALSCFQSAAAAGHPPAYLCLGYIYQHGKGVDKDLVQAADWYDKAKQQESWFLKDEDTASRNDPEGLFNAGFYYHFVKGIKNPNNRMAVESFYQRAGAAGHAAAYLHLGDLYRKQRSKITFKPGHGKAPYLLLDKPRYSDAASCYLKAAKSGCAAAQVDVGTRFFNGDGSSAPDYKQAAKWFRDAADQGHPRAKYYLGHLLKGGLGIEKNESAADELIMSAAAQRDKEAQLFLDPPEEGQFHLVPRLSADDVVKRIQQILKNYRRMGKESKSESELDSNPVPEKRQPDYIDPSIVKANKFNCSTGYATVNLVPPGLALKQELGRGGFGEVYEASCGDKRVAVKRLQLSTKHKRSNKARFEQEAALMLRAGWLSDHIVRLCGIVVEPEFQLVAELMEGGDLATLLHKQRKHNTRLSWLEILCLIKDISSGVADLHMLGVLHRDLKSANILLTKMQRAKIADLGLAEIGRSYEAHRGTRGWMAPELSQAGVTATQSSDIYSLGVVFWELATHRKPYTKSSTDETIPLLREELITALNESQCPADLKELIRQCLSVYPKDRPTMSEILDQINLILGRFFSPVPGSRQLNISTLLEQKATSSPQKQQSQSTTTAVTSKKKLLVEEEKFLLAESLYHKGQYFEALQLFQQIADETDYPPAYLYVAVMYMQGRGGVKKDVRIAAIWRSKVHERSDWFLGETSGVDSNDPKMLFYRGWYHHAMEGDKEGCDNAEIFYQRAWEAGHIVAYIHLGDLYRSIPEWREQAKAVYYYREATEPGHQHVSAQFNLAMCYYQNQGVPRIYEKAAEWFHLAAQQGHVGAQFRLALMCRDNLGIKDKPEWASQWRDWMLRAAEGGHPEAQRVLTLYYEQLDLEQIQRAQQQADKATIDAAIETSVSSLEGSPSHGSTSVSTSSTPSSSPGPLDSKTASQRSLSERGLEAGLFANNVRRKVGGSPGLAILIEEQLKRPTPEDGLDRSPLAEGLPTNQFEL